MDQISANAMKSVIDIDVLGSWNTVKATLPYLIESAKKYPTDGKTEPTKGTGGRIIFVSATLHYGGTPLQSHVSVAKAGVDAMAVSVAIEQGPKGITSNIIAPGPIADTEGVARLSRSDLREKSAKIIPSQRYGTVKEIADATVYLFSDSGNYVNGETIVGKYPIYASLGDDNRLTSRLSRWRAMAHVRRATKRAVPVSRVFAFWRNGHGRCRRQESEVIVTLDHMFVRTPQFCTLARPNIHNCKSRLRLRSWLKFNFGGSCFCTIEGSTHLGSQKWPTQAAEPPFCTSQFRGREFTTAAALDRCRCPHNVLQTHSSPAR